MKVFLDTNVILDYVLQRVHYAEAKQAIVQMLESDDELLMSVGGFYTMVFIVEKYFRKVHHLNMASALVLTRDVMRKTLNTFQVVEHDSASLLRGIDDQTFSDIEDSCQYQLAIKHGCKRLVTFNAVDFPIKDGSDIEIVNLLK